MYKREDFMLKNENRGWFIHAETSLWKYLLKNGQIKTWHELLQNLTKEEAERILFHRTKQDAETFLNNYLKGQNMSLEAKRDQCIADIGVLQSNLAELEGEIEKQQDPFNEVRKYLKDNRCYGYFSVLKEVGNYTFVVVQTPVCNENWTFAVWHWAEEFCKEFNEKDFSVYPIHGYDFQDKNVWIKITPGRKW
jgi:hypothetical protein